MIWNGKGDTSRPYGIGNVLGGKEGRVGEVGDRQIHGTPEQCGWVD